MMVYIFDSYIKEIVKYNNFMKHLVSTSKVLSIMLKLMIKQGRKALYEVLIFIQQT